MLELEHHAAKDALRLGGGPMVDVVQAQRTLSRARWRPRAAAMGDLAPLYAAAGWRVPS